MRANLSPRRRAAAPGTRGRADAWLGAAFVPLCERLCGRRGLEGRRDGDFRGRGTEARYLGVWHAVCSPCLARRSTDPRGVPERTAQFPFMARRVRFFQGACRASAQDVRGSRVRHVHYNPLRQSTCAHVAHVGKGGASALHALREGPHVHARRTCIFASTVCRCCHCRDAAHVL